MRVLVIVIILFIICIPMKIYAYDPLTRDNNKYGIHIIDENDLDNAAALVNSSGGDWGYVTMVITENDRSTDKWQKIFDRMRSSHIIPIIRIATKPKNGIWEKPSVSEAKNWADFLSGLNWVIQNKYIIFFNEPNHAKEWGGTINPKEYTDVISIFASELKNKSQDFFIMLSGFDASAPNGESTMDETKFLREMIAYNPDVFTNIDGWASHSYPNPGFTGKVSDSGRGTLRTYRWELDLLNSLGVKKNLPVFITETGWPHQEGNNNINYYSADDVSELINLASEEIWKDQNIIAVTPFVLNYPFYPFSNFSWQKREGDTFYSQFDSYRSIPKTIGKPIIENPNSNKNTKIQILGDQISNKDQITMVKNPSKIRDFFIKLVKIPLMFLKNII